MDKKRRTIKSLKPFDLVLTDHVWPDLTIETGLLAPYGIRLTAAHCKTEDEVIRIAAGADAICAIHAPFTRNVVQALTECKVISMSAVGYNSVDVDAVTDAGILLVHCPDYCIEEVANHTIALILSCARGLFLFDRRIQEQIWDHRSAGILMRVSTATLGLIGFGKIAQAVAGRAKGFRMNVQAYDPHVDDCRFEQYGVTRVSMEDLLSTSDFVSIHTPLNEATRNMISDVELSMMKSSAFLINTSRGWIIDEEALLKALANGTIRGAAIDTLREEPPDFSSPFFTLENLFLTPHAAFYSEEAVEEVRTRSAKAIMDVYNGILPDHIVNGNVLTNGKLRMVVNANSL